MIFYKYSLEMTKQEYDHKFKTIRFIVYEKRLILESDLHSHQISLKNLQITRAQF